MVFGERKVMPGIKPTVVSTTEAVEGTAFDHPALSRSGGMSWNDYSQLGARGECNEWKVILSGFTVL
jgi:hypothetical protein